MAVRGDVFLNEPHRKKGAPALIRQSFNRYFVFKIGPKEKAMVEIISVRFKEGGKQYY